MVFSWIEWPDKARRDEVMGRMDEIGKTDERLNPEKNPMPFDGKRLIYGGFEPIVERGEAASDSYVQGFVIPVPTDKREDYRKMAEEAWAMFRDYGALRVVEAWGDDVPDGKVTDFRRAVKAGPDEKIVFSFMEWPSREVCDAASERMMKDERMKPPEGDGLAVRSQADDLWRVHPGRDAGEVSLGNARRAGASSCPSSSVPGGRGRHLDR